MIYPELDPDTRGPEAEYQAYLTQGQFMLQQSRLTGHSLFYPRVCLPGTGQTDLGWVAASGYGTLYAITVNRSKSGNYNIALIDLDEGPRMMSCIEGTETAPIGSRVKAEVVIKNDQHCVVFHLIHGTAQ